MEIRLSLYLSPIIEAVKTETFIKSSVEKASDAKVTEVAYAETLGDDAYQERKLSRCIYTSVDKLRGILIDYVTPSDIASRNYNITTDINEEDDRLTIVLEVSENFNTANNDSLARSCSKYIEDTALVLWYGALGTIGTGQAQFYSALVQEDVMTISRMFVKMAPKHPAYPYATQLTIKSGATDIDSLSMKVGDTKALIYKINDNAIDDIEIIKNGNCIVITREYNGTLDITAIREGSCRLTAFSLHNESLKKDVDILITKQ